jgi:hypothetical protein
VAASFVSPPRQHSDTGGFSTPEILGLPFKFGVAFLLGTNAFAPYLLMREQGKRTMSKFTLPYEPEYTGHRDAQKQHQETKEWLLRREREVASPPIVPEHARQDEKVK